MKIGIGSDGVMKLVGDRVEVAIFDTGADNVRKLVAEYQLSVADLFIWGDRINAIREQIAKRNAEAYIETLPVGTLPKRRR